MYIRPEKKMVKVLKRRSEAVVNIYDVFLAPTLLLEFDEENNQYQLVEDLE